MIFILCFLLVFIMLYYRKKVYKLLVKIFGKEINLFEFGFFCIISFTYLILVAGIPVMLNMFDHPSYNAIMENNTFKRYLIFSGAASLCVAAVASFNIFPVNNYDTPKALNHLIETTRDLLKTSNKTLVVVTGAIIVGSVLGGKDKFYEIRELYVAVYGVISVAFGVSGVLASRLAELLHKYSDLELKEYKTIEEYNKKKCPFTSGHFEGLINDPRTK